MDASIMLANFCSSLCLMTIYYITLYGTKLYDMI